MLDSCIFSAVADCSGGLRAVVPVSLLIGALLLGSPPPGWAGVDASMSFPQGETLLTARVRDDAGNLGPAARIVVRILNP